MFKSQEERRRRFDIEIEQLLGSFKNDPATIRVQFLGNGQVHLVGGRKFVPPTVSCQEQFLPKFITDKIAILKVHGARAYVDGVGKWLDKNSFYVDVTPNEWEKFYEDISSS